MRKGEEVQEAAEAAAGRRHGRQTGGFGHCTVVQAGRPDRQEDRSGGKSEAGKAVRRGKLRHDLCGRYAQR